MYSSSSIYIVLFTYVCFCAILLTNGYPQFSDFTDSGDQISLPSQIVEGKRRLINPMTESCLACICQASTNCNLTTRCINKGKYCGPFLISKPYWLDAGQLTLVGDKADRSGAFEDCANDPICSAQSVRTYMLIHQKDCNRDGLIDCDDMGRIHLMGATDCGNPRVPKTPFYRRFRQCFDKVLQLSQ
jgi:hypothetical protein